MVSCIKLRTYKNNHIKRKVQIIIATCFYFKTMKVLICLKPPPSYSFTGKINNFKELQEAGEVRLFKPLLLNTSCTEPAWFL